MTKQAAQFTAAILAALGVGIALALDVHRHIIAAVWPHVVAYLDWLVA